MGLAGGRPRGPGLASPFPMARGTRDPCRHLPPALEAAVGGGVAWPSIAAHTCGGDESSALPAGGCRAGIEDPITYLSALGVAGLVPRPAASPQGPAAAFGMVRALQARRAVRLMPRSLARASPPAAPSSSGAWLPKPAPPADGAAPCPANPTPCWTAPRPNWLWRRRTGGAWEGCGDGTVVPERQGWAEGSGQGLRNVRPPSRGAAPGSAPFFLDGASPPLGFGLRASAAHARQSPGCGGLSHSRLPVMQPRQTCRAHAPGAAGRRAW